MIPTKAPGSLFSSFTGDDSTLNIRWLVATDPVFFETLNRVSADLAVRQLVLAKAIDNIQLGLGHLVLYPFLIQPKVVSGTQQMDLPPRWVWDFHASMPKKWENLRLARIKRISGENNATSGYNGLLRLIFTANIENSPNEVSIFSADYRIDSPLTYQPIRLVVVNSLEEPVPIDSGEAETVAGFLIFRTLDTDIAAVISFMDLLEPSDTTDNNGDGIYDNPAVYELADSLPGGTNVSDDFATVSVTHGTGLLTDSAWNPIPQLDSDIQSWIVSFNYPFGANANRTSVDNITIPGGLFREFNIVAPAGDQATGDTSGLTYPVWISRIEKLGTGSDRLRFYFSTFNVTDFASGGTPSTAPIEFAIMDLYRSSTQGEMVSIIPVNNLQLKVSTDKDYFEQHFGRGHAVLSSLWDKTTDTIDTFFDEFGAIVNNPPDTEFTISSTRISSFGTSRVPKYIPTVGQSRALLGSTSRRNVPVHPSFDNRYVTEGDQGFGNQIDLEAQPGITPHGAIERISYQGALTHRIAKLDINATSVGDDPEFYNKEILPRLRVLFGRDPQFGDFYHNGTRLLFFNGNTWQG